MFIKKLTQSNSLQGSSTEPGDQGDQEITCIPNNEEKYISFSKKMKVDEYKDEKGKIKNVMRETRFIDSFRFMPDSLNALLKNLKKE